MKNKATPNPTTHAICLGVLYNTVIVRNHKNNSKTYRTSRYQKPKANACFVIIIKNKAERQTDTICVPFAYQHTAPRNGDNSAIATHNIM